MAYTERRYELSDLTEVGGGTSLTNNGSAAFTTGKSGNAVSLVTASSQYLSVSDSAFNGVANTDATEPFTIYGWFYLNATGQNHGIAGQNTSSYHVHVISTDKLRFRVNRATSGNLTLDNALTLSGSTWYWFCAEYNPAVNLVSLEVTPASSSTRNAPATSAINDATGLASGTGPFTIGSIGSGNFAEALVDVVGFRRNGLLSGDEKSMFFNSGSARSHAEVDTLKTERPYVYQEFFDFRTANGTSNSVGVRNLVEGHIATVVSQIDGNASDISIADWDSAWTLEDSEVATQASSTFCRNRVWSRTVSATDASTETSVDISWTGTQQDATLVQFWANCGGVNAIQSTGGTTGTTSHTAPAATTTVDGCAIEVFLGVDGAYSVTAYPSTIKKHGETGSNLGGGQGLLWGGTFQASLGSTGTFAFTTAAGESAIAITLAMEPAATEATIEPADASVAVSGQATTISQVHAITPAAASVAPAADGTTINQNHVVQVNDGAVAPAAQATTITQNHVIQTANGSVAVTVQTTTIVQGLTITPEDASVAPTAQATTITQVHIIVPASGAVSLSAAIATILQNHVIAPAGAAVSVSVENASISVPRDIGSAVAALGTGLQATPRLGAALSATATIGN